MSNQNEIRKSVTEKIVASLRAGSPPWRRPWSDLENCGFPANAVSRRSYRGVNPWLLQIVAQQRSYQSRWWATFNQWRGMGFQIKKRPDDVAPGAYGSKVVLFKPITKSKKADDGEEKTSKFFVLREFVVFNAEQVTGPGIEKYLAHPKAPSTFIDCERAEQVMAATGAVIQHGGGSAFYRPADDFIQMPPKNAFSKPHEYYSVAAHELTHWTGAKSRLNRLDTLARFGSESYAIEELIAELGAAFLSAELGIPQSDDLSNVTAYLAHWLAVLEKDVTAIFTASSAASKAVDFILAFSEKRTEADDEAEPVELVGGVA